MSDPGELAFSGSFWEERLLPGDVPSSVELKVQLVFSLIVYLALPLHHLLLYIFSSNVRAVKDRAAHFMAYHAPSGNTPSIFHPATLFREWQKRFPKARRHLCEEIIQPCAEEIALQESDKIIKEPAFQIRTKTLTIAELRRLANPQNMLGRIQELAPFTYGFLRAFTASPNEYRKRKKGKGFEGQDEGTEARTQTGRVLEDSDDEDGDDLDAAGMAWREHFPGFARNPVFVSIVTNETVQFARLPLTHSGNVRLSWWQYVCARLRAIAQPTSSRSRLVCSSKYRVRASAYCRC